MLNYKILALSITAIMFTGASEGGGLLSDQIDKAVGIVKVTPPTSGSSRILNDTDQEVSLAEPKINQFPQLVPIDAYPWAVALAAAGNPQLDSAHFFCGGVAVAKDWVLTTAYCATTSSNIDTLRILSGDADLTQATSYEVDKIIVHPHWERGTHTFDLALLHAKIKNKEFVPIALGDDTSAKANVGEIGQVVGWGVTNLTDPPKDFLQLIPTRLLSNELCSSAYAGMVSDGEFCAQSLLKTFDACFGFAGSALVLNDRNGKRYLGGIVSWGEGCPPRSYKPTVYSDARSFSQWTRETLK